MKINFRHSTILLIAILILQAFSFGQKIDLLQTSKEFIDAKQLDSALHYSKLAIQNSKKKNQPEKELEAILLQGRIGFFNQDYKALLTSGFESLPLSIMLNDSNGMFMSYLNLAIGHDNIKDFDKALEYNNKALKLAEHFPDKHNKSVVLGNIGNIYKTMRDNDIAEKYYRETIDILLNNNIKNSLLLGNAYSNIGIIHIDSKKYKKALEYIDKAKDKYDDHLKTPEVCYVILKINKANALANLNRVDEALSLILPQIEKTKDINAKFAETSIYLLLTSPEFGFNQKERMRYAQLGLEASRKYKFIDKEISSLKEMETIAIEKKDYTKAYDLLQNISTLSDSMMSKENRLMKERFNIEYEVSKKNSEVALLKSKAETQRIKTLILAVISITILIIAFIIIKTQRSNSKKNKIIAEKEKQVFEETLLTKQAVIDKNNLEIETNKEKLSMFLNSLIYKNKLVSTLKDSIKDDKIKKEHITEVLSDKILTEEDWIEFQKKFEIVQPNFIFKVKSQYPKLTNSELRLFLLLKLQRSTNEICDILGVSISTVHKTRQRLKSKLEIDVPLNTFTNNF